MDWNFAIEKNREALQRILVTLFALVAANSGGAGMQPADQPPMPHRKPALAEGLFPAATLPRHLHRFVLRLLRPAEAAVRRLIIVAARDIVVEPAAPRPARADTPSIFVSDGAGTGIVLSPHRQPGAARKDAAGAAGAPRRSTLSLLDPLKRWGAAPRYPGRREAPRISFFDACDRPREPDRLPLSPDDCLDAGRLHRRLDAVAVALQDLPRQAKRLALWRARRDARLARETIEGEHAGGEPLPPATSRQAKPRPQRFSPMRPGRPPGWRKRPTHPVHEVLRDLHGLAVWAMERPDSS